MARNKAQYKTVAVDATEAGVITFREPLTVGSVTYKGLTWTGPYTPNVDGLSCTIRTPLQSEAHPLEYFFTYPVNKYEGGTPVFIPYSRLCLPTAEDDIPGMTGTERYIFYPYTQPGGGTPPGLAPSRFSRWARDSASTSSRSVTGSKIIPYPSPSAPTKSKTTV